MDCKKLKDRLLTDYLDKELGAIERASVDGHLAGCSACRGFFRNLQESAVAPFKGVPEIQPDEIVWRRIQEQIAAESAHASGGFWGLVDLLVSRFPLPVPMMRVAFVTALVLVTVVLARWPSGSIHPAYAYVEEQMTFMNELGAGNTELMNGELKDYETTYEEIGR